MTQASNQTISRKIFELGTQPSIVLSSRFGLLYLLMERDKLRTFYMDPATRRFSLNKLTVLVCVDAFMWQTGSVSIERCIVDLARQHADQTDMLVWLASIGYTDNLLADIRRIAKQIDVVPSDHSSEGIVLFQMPLRAVKNVLFWISQRSATESHCTGPIVIEY